MGIADINPNSIVGTYVEAKNWNKVIRDPDVVLIDTRNDYEVEIGSFEGSINPETRNFREFPAWVENNREKLQNKKIIAFAGYAVFISVTFFLMPENPDEITAPMELVDGFRGASFVAVTIYWLTLGLILGGFIEKLQERLNLKR